MRSIKLNENFTLQFCEEGEKDSMNGLGFQAKPEWCFSKDQGERYSYSCRFIFWTVLAKAHKGIQFGTPKAAIQFTLIKEFPDKKLSQIWFKIIEERNYLSKKQKELPEDKDEDDENN